jgi:hypothetical protein
MEKIEARATKKNSSEESKSKGSKEESGLEEDENGTKNGAEGGDLKGATYYFDLE